MLSDKYAPTIWEIQTLFQMISGWSGKSLIQPRTDSQDLVYLLKL